MPHLRPLRGWRKTVLRVGAEGRVGEVPRGGGGPLPFRVPCERGPKEATGCVRNRGGRSRTTDVNGRKGEATGAAGGAICGEVGGVAGQPIGSRGVGSPVQAAVRFRFWCDTPEGGGGTPPPYPTRERRGKISTPPWGWFEWEVVRKNFDPGRGCGDAGMGVVEKI